MRGFVVQNEHRFGAGAFHRQVEVPAAQRALHHVHHVVVLHIDHDIRAVASGEVELARVGAAGDNDHRRKP